MGDTTHIIVVVVLCAVSAALGFVLVKLLDRLREGEGTVLELTEAIGTTEQNVSKHLGVLHRAGVVARRRQGSFVYYSILDASVFERYRLDTYREAGHKPFVIAAMILLTRFRDAAAVLRGCVERNVRRRAM